MCFLNMFVHVCLLYIDTSTHWELWCICIFYQCHIDGLTNEIINFFFLILNHQYIKFYMDYHWWLWTSVFTLVFISKLIILYYFSKSYTHFKIIHVYLVFYSHYLFLIPFNNLLKIQYANNFLMSVV